MKQSTNDLITVMSIHWGFSPGGISKYATLLESVSQYSAIKIKSACVIGKSWQIDDDNFNCIDVEKIVVKSRLDFSWIFKISLLIKRSTPHMIFTHGFNGHFVSIVARIVSNINVPIVCSYHGKYHASTFRRTMFGKMLDRFTVFFIQNIAIGTVCVSKFSLESLRKSNIDTTKITVIHNGIENKLPDFTQRTILRRRWGVDDDELLYGVASRLEPIKGIGYLINAMNLIQNDITNAKLVIIGSGALAQHLHEQVVCLGLNSRVIFAGYRSDIDQCLGAIDIFIQPSLEENHSIAILEAMRASKPIIATNVGGNTESVRHMEEAIIVSSKSAKSLAMAMKELAEDDILRKRLGEKARLRFLEKFTVEVMVRKTAQWLVGCNEMKKTETV